jgi:hypothetical protein
VRVGTIARPKRKVAAHALREPGSSARTPVAQSSWRPLVSGMRCCWTLLILFRGALTDLYQNPGSRKRVGRLVAAGSFDRLRREAKERLTIPTGGQLTEQYGEMCELGMDA